MQTNYRSIWKQFFGDIPIDEEGRSYDIHHIDGNHENNNILNLKCISIDDHYNIHFAQGDYAACHLIALRKAQSPKELSKTISDLNKLRIGDKNPFFGRTHSNETKDYLSKINSGVNNFWFGKKRPEFAKKVSVALKGKTKSDKHRAALSESKKGKAYKQFRYNMLINEEETVIVNLKAFCRDHSLPYHKIRAGIEVNGIKLL